MYIGCWRERGREEQGEGEERGRMGSRRRKACRVVVCWEAGIGGSEEWDGRVGKELMWRGAMKEREERAQVRRRRGR